MSEEERVSRFVEAVKNDPRVLGVAQIRTSLPDVPRLVVVTTWDGFVSLPSELARLCAPLLGGAPTIQRTEDELWRGLGADGFRAEVELRRIGDLVPNADECEALAIHDPYGFVATWIRYSAAADSSRDDETVLTPEEGVAEDALNADYVLRWAALGHGQDGRDPWFMLRYARASLADANAAHAALADRIDRHLRSEPGEPETRVFVGRRTPSVEMESFLKVADDEGFKGDRVLFGEATKRLRDLSKREPVFDQGFVVPTFDAVEAAFALGEAVGGCQPPLIPGVYVGVGVTPTDALEFWAAPFVRDPTCSVACVDDAGERDVVERAAGREPMVATLTSAIDAAWERLPALIDRARDAAKEQVDPSAVLAPLHLPRSFVERAKRRGAGALMCSRLTVALAVARAGHDCAPLVARKFGLAAGRVLAAR